MRRNCCSISKQHVSDTRVHLAMRCSRLKSPSSDRIPMCIASAAVLKALPTAEPRKAQRALQRKRRIVFFDAIADVDWLRGAACFPSCRSCAAGYLCENRKAEVKSINANGQGICCSLDFFWSYQMEKNMSPLQLGSQTPL